MENYENIYKSICRLCLRYRNSNKMVSLFDQNGLTSHAKAVSTFADIILNKQDNFPSNMCLNCLHLLKQAIYFKLIAESSNNRLKQLANSLENNKKGLRDKIIEYTMFKLYFPPEYLNTTRNRGCKRKKRHISPKENTELNHSMESVTKAEENQLCINDSLDNDVYDSPKLKTDSEQDDTHSGVQILDKIENFIGSNISETQKSTRKQFKRNKRNLKRNNIGAKQQYKLAIQQQRLHGKRNLKVKRMVCNICNKELANQLTHYNHMQRHNGCRYICEHCGKGFPVLTELQVHQVTSHGTGPHLQCPRCPFKAPRKFDLIEHERIHSGERPFACDKCGLTFRRRGIWKKHLIYHTEKKIQCPQCPRKFFQRSDMLAHANNIHDRVYVYMCTECGVTYAKPATVRRHLTERHGIPREIQGKIKRINKSVSCEEQ